MTQVQAGAPALGAVPVILPLIRQHAETAAFYWSLRDGSLDRYGLTASRMQHFAQLLSAHQRGL